MTPPCDRWSERFRTSSGELRVVHQWQLHRWLSRSKRRQGRRPVKQLPAMPWREGYAYQATVASDSNYTGATSLCEPLTVTPKQLAITTDIHDVDHKVVTSVGLGAIVHDTANVTGGVSGFALPAVSFEWFTNGSCTDGSAVANDGKEGDLFKQLPAMPWREAAMLTRRLWPVTATTLVPRACASR